VPPNPSSAANIPQTVKCNQRVMGSGAEKAGGSTSREGRPNAQQRGRGEGIGHVCQIPMGNPPPHRQGGVAGEESGHVRCPALGQTGQLRPAEGFSQTGNCPPHLQLQGTGWGKRWVGGREGVGLPRVRRLAVTEAGLGWGFAQ
jgi:hypothetical protein